MKTRRLLLLMGLVIVVFALTSCENALAGSGDHDSGIGPNTTLATIRSVTDDPVSGCINENAHSHNGESYSGHFNNDGHGHHGLKADEPCAQAGCQETGLHQHNGTHYTGHFGGDESSHHGQHGNGHE